MTAVHDDTLQRYFDDELPEAEMAEISAALEKSPELRRRLDNLERLQRLMRRDAMGVGRDLDADALFAKITEGLEQAPAPLRSVGTAELGAEGRAQQAQLGPEGRAQQAERRERDPINAGSGAIPRSERDSNRAQRIPTRQSSRAYVWLAMGVAAAAVLAIALKPWDSSVTMTQRPTMQIEPSVITTVDPPHGSEVVEVDFGENTGTVFAVEGNTGEPLAVVWIDDEQVAQ